MRKLIYLVCIALFAVVITMFLSACNPSGIPKSSNYSDEYLESEDFNPNTVSWLGKPHGVTVLDDTLYFIAGHYLFFADAKSQEARPLCFKPECLHFSEPDPYKVSECDAYLGDVYIQTILGHCNGKLYFSCLNQKTGHIDIVESKPDGSERKSVLSDIDDLASVCFHRGVFYYVLRTVEITGEQTTSLLAYSILAQQKEPYKIIEYTDGSTIETLLPYGASVIFSKDSPYVEEIGSDIELHRYNIKSGEVTDFPFEMDVNIYGLCDDKLIVQMFNEEVGLKFWEYNFSDESLTLCEWLNDFYEKQQPAVTLYDQIQEDITFAFFMGEDYQPNYDLYVVNRDGDITATLEGAAWGTTTSETVTWLGKTYYMAYRTLDPFSICLYENGDLLQGKLEPLTLLQVDGFGKLMPAAVLPAYDVLD